MSEQEIKHYYRIPPCPAYDIEGMESWLSDMASQGMFLSKDGFFLGVTSFEKGHRERAAYRLQAAKGSTSMWADNNGDPDDEELELSGELGWEYVAKRGQFYIYKAADGTARELNTDLQVQALAIDELRKRESSSLISCFIWLFIYPLIYFRTAIFTPLIVLGPFTVFLLILFTLLLYVENFLNYRHFKKLRKRLSEGEDLDHRKNWEESKYRYLILRAAKIISIIAVVILLLYAWSRDLTDEDKIPIESYSAEIPFATVADFEPEGEYKAQNFGFGNEIKVMDNSLARDIISYDEIAEVHLPDGSFLDGSYYVDYCETRYEWLAGAVAREYLRMAKLERKVEKELELPELGVDYAAMYVGDMHYHTLIIQSGCKVIKARFFEMSETYDMDWNNWARIIADSIK